MDWRTSARCQEDDPELFFPERTDRKTLAEARKVCASCDVRAECLQDALDNRVEHGVWGGLTKSQRDGVLRQRAALRQGAPRVSVAP